MLNRIIDLQTKENLFYSYQHEVGDWSIPESKRGPAVDDPSFWGQGKLN